MVLLADLLPPAGSTPDLDDLLTRFLDGVESRGITLYPAQEEAILALLSGEHVVLATPTGSGKSLVAEALHFKSLALGRRSVYTAPVKALVNEKFFALIDAFGAERVGLLTGDASVNRDAPIVCCTAEILARMSLTADGAGIDDVIMDEFHYYGDRDRGTAWQLPLLSLRQATFLLMSATLGPTDSIAASLEAVTHRRVATVRGLERPVPLYYEYREDLLQETVQDLVAQDKAPIYIVNFTQRSASETAQALTSVNVTSREEKARIGELLREARFDTPFGKELGRLVRVGVGVHHGGLLPKYRRVVERLAQRGLLKVVSGTDTLGVGVNIPIRTVLFTALSKYDGNKTGLLTARDFHQIAGRAGRTGFDIEGRVVALAPEHVVENLRLARKAQAGRKVQKRSAPEGFVTWDQKTFDALCARPPEPLVSRFKVTYGMLVDLLSTGDLWPRRGYGRLVELIARCHDSDGQKRRHRRTAASMVRALIRAGVVERCHDQEGAFLDVSESLQHDFSLQHTLELWLLDAVGTLEPASESYALDLLTLVESTLPDPEIVLRRQTDVLKQQRIGELKAAGVPYEERMTELEKVEAPRPNADAIAGMFAAFCELHPWARGEDVRPKSVARDLVERLLDFNGYVLEYGLERSEGTLLRYLSDVYRILMRTVPESALTEATDDVVAWLRDVVRTTDASLLDEWERLRDRGLERPEADAEAPIAPPEPHPDDPIRLVDDPRKLMARVRTELHRLVHALAERRWEDALRCVSPLHGLPEWTPETLEAELAPYFAAHEHIDLRPVARLPDKTVFRRTGPTRTDASQKLCDPDLGEEPEDANDEPAPRTRPGDGLDTGFRVNVVVELDLPSRALGLPLIALRSISE